MATITLNVLGFSYSQSQSGAYALVLTEEEGDRRIPIIIGGFEAQAIAIQLEGLKPPRPLTHDLFHNFAKAFNIKLLEVTIHKLEEGVFYSKLLCDNGGQQLVIDARTSDAIALALRFKCPIYTTEEIMAQAGIILDLEEAEEELEVQYQGEEFEIGFNVSYFIDALAAIKAETVEVKFTDSNQSCLVHAKGDSSCRYVIMPMRL